MINNIFQAKYKGLELWKQRPLSDLERLIPSFYKRGLQVYPHQIEAAISALSNPLSKGFILCDETGLGKAVEAMLVISQLYFAGKKKIVVVVPNPLINQWKNNLDKFDLPNTQNLSECDNDEEGSKILVISYNHASDIWEQLKEIQWNLAVFEEAHRLRKFYTNENQTATNLHNAFIGRKKLLLTATPMQVNVMDLFGLINFIDDTVFTDDKNFYKRYYKKPENYKELGDRLIPFTYRTLRNQVKLDVCLTERNIHTQEYSLNEQEKQLYSLLEKYINKPHKEAFPEMDLYELNLMMFKLFSSSIYALSKTLAGVYHRLNQMGKAEAIEEGKQVKEMLDLATSIVDTSKWEVFYKGLTQGLEELKAKGQPEKVLIYTENKQTQEYIFKQLQKHNKKLKAICFEDESSIDKFRKSASLMIATDLASEGFNIEFCSFIINYDLPWNVQKIEQRIGRCHRIGQKYDVSVLNFLNRENYADVRFYELVFKRTTMFDGILGSSDLLISDIAAGNIEKAVGELVASGKSKDEIEKEFTDLQEQYKSYVAEHKQESNELLFNTFDKKAVEKTKNYAEYIKQKCEELKVELWNFCRYAFKPYDSIDEEKKMIFVNRSPFSSGNIPSMFLYLDGDRTRSEMITLNNTTVDKVNARIWLNQQTEGRISFEDKMGKHSGKSGVIALYTMNMHTFTKEYASYSFIQFVGFDSNGNELSHDECREIFNLSSTSHSVSGVEEKKVKAIEVLLEKVKPQIIEQANIQNISWVREEVDKIKNRYLDKLRDLQAEIESLERELSKLKGGNKQGEYSTAFMKNYEISNLTARLNQLKQNEFITKMKLNKEQEEEIKKLQDSAKPSVYAPRSFVVEFNIN